MTMMTLNMPKSMQRWVEDEAAKGGFDDPGQIVRDLIHREQVRKKKIAHMQRLIDEGLASGVSDQTIDEIWDNARRRAVEAGFGS